MYISHLFEKNYLKKNYLFRLFIMYLKLNLLTTKFFDLWRMWCVKIWYIYIYIIILFHDFVIIVLKNGVKLMNTNTISKFQYCGSHYHLAPTIFKVANNIPELVLLLRKFPVHKTGKITHLICLVKFLSNVNKRLGVKSIVHACLLINHWFIQLKRVFF